MAYTAAHVATANMTGEHDPRGGQRFTIRDNGDPVWQPQSLAETVTAPTNHLYSNVSNTANPPLISDTAVTCDTRDG